jgi:hypothetical protein
MHPETAVYVAEEEKCVKREIPLETVFTLGTDECLAKSRAWIMGKCSDRCLNKEEVFDEASDICIKLPVQDSCVPGLFWNVDLERCTPHFIDLLKEDCILADLYWLPKNTKKGRSMNGCYTRCKTKGFFFDLTKNQC